MDEGWLSLSSFSKEQFNDTSCMLGSKRVSPKSRISSFSKYVFYGRKNGPVCFTLSILGLLSKFHKYWNSENILEGL